jgi:multidrug efflux system membrane fusion protein
VRQLQGTVLSDQAQVDNAKLQLSYTRVTAPISGLAGLKQADLGNVVRASDTNGIVSITQTQPVNVVFAVPDTQLPKITKQLKAGEILRVEAWDRDQKMKLADGKVASTDNSIDTTTGTIKLKALFANTDGGLFPNQFVNVRLQMDTLTDATAVPSAAVLRGTQGNYVYVVNEDKTVSIRRVRAGAVDGDWMSVQGEVKVGDVVVTDGTDRLREGASVEVVIPPAPSTGTGGNRGGRNRPGSDGAAPGAPAGVAPAAAPTPTGGQSAATPSGASPAPATQSKSGVVSGGVPAAAVAPASGASPAAPAAAGDRPAWMDRLPPDVQEKLKAMTPEERAAWIAKRREERAKRQAEGGGGGGPPN